MDEITLQTIVSYLQKYKRILIALPESPTVDVTAAGLALASALGVLDKTVEIVSSGSVPKRATFLSGAANIHGLTLNSSQLVIKVNTTESALGELSYTTTPEKVTIFLRAKSGQFSPSDVTTSAGDYPYDLLIVLGAENPEQLGDVFSKHTELFYSLPRINIDINPRNDNHGTLNLVNVTASSVSELCYHALSALDRQSTVAISATALLAGILASTDSLKNQHTTPDTFAVVADLIAAGADYAQVVKNLFKTERLGFLKLWGRSLARLKVVDAPAFAYSVLLPADFEKTQETVAVLKELLSAVHENVSGMLSIAVAGPTEDGKSHIVAMRSPQFSTQYFISSLTATDSEFSKLDNGEEIVSVIAPVPIEQLEPLLVQSLTVALTDHY